MFKIFGSIVFLLLLGFQGAHANEFQKCRAEFKSQKGEVVVSKDICPTQTPQRKISSINLSAGKCGKNASLVENCMIPNQKISPVVESNHEPYSVKVLSVGIN